MGVEGLGGRQSHATSQAKKSRPKLGPKPFFPFSCNRWMPSQYGTFSSQSHIAKVTGLLREPALPAICKNF